MYVEEELNKFGRYMVKESRKNLTRRGKRDRGDLYKSLSYTAKQSPNSFEFSFMIEDYGEFVDQGVKGTESSLKAPFSKFQFGTGTGKKGGLTKSISGWVKRKGLQFRNKKGQFITRKATTFLIVRSIFRTGLETTLFYSRPFELGFKRLPDDIVEAYALELEDFLKASVNN